MSKWDCDSKYVTYTKTGTQDEVDEFRDSVGYVSAEWQLSKRKTYDRIFEMGLQLAMDQIVENGSGLQPGSSEYEKWERSQDRKRRKDRFERWSDYRDMEREDGLDYLIEWANEREIDISDYLENRSRFAKQAKEENATHRVDTWIMEKLADGEIHKTKDLRPQAKEDGFGDINWNTITQRAVRIGVTQASIPELKDGEWQWKGSTDRSVIL